MILAADAELIAAARNALSGLLDALDATDAQLAEARRKLHIAAGNLAGEAALIEEAAMGSDHWLARTAARLRELAEVIAIHWPEDAGVVRPGTDTGDDTDG